MIQLVMGKTINWMMDKIPKLDKEAALYYKTFNNLYYNHRKPTEEHCKILGITMERALEIVKESNSIENAQRRDCQNFVELNKPPKNSKAGGQTDNISYFERVTNRKGPTISDNDTGDF